MALQMETPVKSFQRISASNRRIRTKFRKCVMCYKDLLLAKKYYTLSYCGPATGCHESLTLGQRIANILNETLDNISRIAGHACITCKCTVEKVEKGRLSPDKFKELFNKAHCIDYAAHKHIPAVEVVKRMARSPGKNSETKRRHLDYESSEENIPPPQHSQVNPSRFYTATQICGP